MKKTKKYLGATEILTFPHSTQDELYAELNRLGWYWKSKNGKWERDDREPIVNDLVKIRVWARTEIVEEVAEHFVEAAEERGLRFIEKSRPYQCRPPSQLESRVYLTFHDEEG